MEHDKLKAFYDEIYKKGKNTFFTKETTDITEEIIRELQWKGKTVLEIGCGTGETAYFISQLGATVTAMDYSSEAIKIAQTTHQHDKVTYQVGSFDDMAGKWDCIVLQEVIEHVDEPYTVLKKVVSHIVEGGHLIITCPSFLNVRGVVWMTLQLLFDVPMSLTDKHFLAPKQFEQWAQELGCTIAWHTFRHEQAHGSDMFNDMKKRLNAALRDAHLPNDRVSALLEWLKEVCTFQKDELYNGAKALYHLARI